VHTKFQNFWRWWSWLIGPSTKKEKKFGNFALFHNKSFRTLHTPKQGLLKGFCDVSKIGDNPENNLAKFGYTPAMKAFFWKNRMLLYYWLPGGTYHKNLVILVLFCCFSKSGGFGHFPHEITFFRSNIWKKFANKEKHCSQVRLWLIFPSCMAHLCRATEKNFVQGVWDKTWGC